MKKLLTTFIVTFVFSFSYSQSIKTSIEASDVWGAWFIEGTNKAWLIDGIPERARLWDYEKGVVLLDMVLELNVKDVNVLNDGSLAYVSHSRKNEYIVLNQSGVSSSINFKPNAPSYYIHPDGKYFFGSTFEGFITYSIKNGKISKSKTNNSITGYSSAFVETGNSKNFFRFSKDVIQKVEIAENGALKVSRAFENDKLLMSEKGDQFVLVNKNSFKIYNAVDLSVVSTSTKNSSFDFQSAVYDDNSGSIFFSNGEEILRFDLEKEEFTDSGKLAIDDLYFSDRMGKSMLCFSDEAQKFFILEF